MATTTSVGAGATLVASASSVHDGDLLTLRGGGFTPGAHVVITFASPPAQSATPVVVGTATANADGQIAVTVPVPPTAAAGSHHFEANGAGPHGHLTRLLAPVDVVSLKPLGGHRSWAATGIMVGIALAVPLLTWMFFGVSPRLRRAGRSRSR